MRPKSRGPDHDPANNHVPTVLAICRTRPNRVAGSHEMRQPSGLADVVSNPTLAICFSSSSSSPGTGRQVSNIKRALTRVYIDSFMITLSCYSALVCISLHGAVSKLKTATETECHKNMCEDIISFVVVVMIIQGWNSVF